MDGARSSPHNAGGGKRVSENVWLVTFMEYDLGCFNDGTCRLEPIDYPFGPKLLPMSPE
jgi:putative transposase